MEGINIPDIKTYIKALKLTWLRKLYQNQPNWRRFLQATCPEIDSIKTYRPSMLTARKVNPFWINVFQGYENISDTVDLNSASELLTEPLFLIKINKKVFHFKEWTSKNIFFVKAVLNEVGKSLYVQEFNQKYDLNVQVLE